MRGWEEMMRMYNPGTKETLAEKVVMGKWGLSFKDIDGGKQDQTLCRSVGGTMPTPHHFLPAVFCLIKKETKILIIDSYLYNLNILSANLHTTRN